MGPGFVFVFYIIAIAVLSAPFALIGIGAGRLLARRAGTAVRKQFMRFGAWLPFFAGVYFLVVVIAMAILGQATHRGLGFGDFFEIPLNNGYRWTAVDEPRIASIEETYPNHEARTNEHDAQGSSYFVTGGQPQAFENVLSLQQSGDWLAGSYIADLDPTKFDRVWPDHWFLFNTRTHIRIDASNEASLAKLAVDHGFRLHLEDSADFYSQQRYRWYDNAVLFLLFIPGLVLLIRTWNKARRMLQADAAIETAVTP